MMLLSLACHWLHYWRQRRRGFNVWNGRRHHLGTLKMITGRRRQSSRWSGKKWIWFRMEWITGGQLKYLLLPPSSSSPFHQHFCRSQRFEIKWRADHQIFNRQLANLKNRFKSTRQIRHNCVPMLFTSFSPHLFLFLYLVIKMSFFLANTTVLHKQTGNSIIDVTNLVVPSNERKK